MSPPVGLYLQDAHPLREATLEMVPFVGGDDARHEVERPQRVPAGSAAGAPEDDPLPRRQPDDEQAEEAADDGRDGKDEPRRTHAAPPLAPGAGGKGADRGGACRTDPGPPPLLPNSCIREPSLAHLAPP